MALQGSVDVPEQEIFPIEHIASLACGNADKTGKKDKKIRNLLNRRRNRPIMRRILALSAKTGPGV